MKTVLIGVVAALALSALPAVYAQDSSVSVSAARHAHYQMQPDEFGTYRNVYLLENGQKITFSNRLTKLYARLDDGMLIRIYATSPTSFVTDNGARFDFREAGETVAISDFQKMPLAANVPANGIMMARR